MGKKYLKKMLVQTNQHNNKCYSYGIMILHKNFLLFKYRKGFLVKKSKDEGRVMG